MRSVIAFVFSVLAMFGAAESSIIPSGGTHLLISRCTQWMIFRTHKIDGFTSIMKASTSLKHTEYI